jgi:hypothetical protein
MSQQPLISHVVHEILDVMSPMDLAELAIGKIDKLHDSYIFHDSVRTALRKKHKSLIINVYRSQQSLSFENITLGVLYFLIDEDDIMTHFRVTFHSSQRIIMINNLDKYVHIYSNNTILLDGFDRSVTCRIYVQTSDIRLCQSVDDHDQK